MADIDDFDLDLETAQAWAEFADRLSEVLSVMDSSGDLTITVERGQEADSAPAIRFSAGPKAEVRGQVLRFGGKGLAELGWQPDAAGVHWAWAKQDQTTELARLSAKTLAGPLGALHPVFLKPDQLAEILRPGGDPLIVPQLPKRGPYGLVMPTSQAQLDAVVDSELAELLGHQPMRTAQGDVAIRVGSAIVFLRSTPDLQELVLFSALVHEVAGRSQACEVLNDLNQESRYCRFALHKDRVFVQVSVAAKPFVPAHLKQAFREISLIADGIDDELATRLSGRTSLPS